jgi:alpha-tubulin suppressor-like RCC1 family protein
MSNSSLGKRLSSLFVVFIFCGLPTLLFFQNCSSSFKVMPLPEKVDPVVFSVPQIEFIEPVTLSNSVDYTATFKVNSSAALNSTKCALNDGPPQDCSTLSITYPALADGDYILQVNTETIFGVKNNASLMFRQDTALPIITVSTQPAILNNMNTAPFLFAVMDNLSGVEKVECSLDAAEFAACASPVNLTALLVGNHNFKIRAYDKAGNLSLPYSYNWTIDLTVPTVSFSQMPLAITNKTTATFAFSGTGIITYECQLDAAAFAACTSPVALANLGAGSHTFKVRGKNTAGTVSEPIMFTWIVDNVAPTLPVIMANIPALTNLTSAQFNLSSTDAVGLAASPFTCSIDNAAYSSCESIVKLTNLSESKHVIKVKAQDKAGNISEEAMFNWTIDITAPKIIFSIVPKKITLGSFQFKFTVSDSSSLNSVKCFYRSPVKTLDSFDCSTGQISSKLDPASYVLNIEAIDAVGNKAQAHYGWEIDDGSGAPLARYKSIKAGIYHMCGITMNDTVRCWGIKDISQSSSIASSIASEVPNLTGVKAISAGYLRNCALLSNGQVKCWDQASGFMYPENGVTGATSISAGANHACAIIAEGRVNCWGSNSDGQLGDGTQNDSSTAVEVKNIKAAKAISVQFDRSCIITNEDKVQCWGNNSNFPIGTRSLIPVEIPGLVNVKSLETGVQQASYYDACIIDTAGVVKCWVNSIKEVQGLPKMKSLALNSSNCGITLENKVWCWGSNHYGDLGTQEDTTLSEVYGLDNTIEVAKGSLSTCALDSDYYVRCWGTNTMGTLGYNSMTLTLKPNLEFSAALSNVKSISGKFGRYCALDFAGQVTCWGHGVVDTKNELPNKILGLGKVKSLAIGDIYNCALEEAGPVKCWSYGNFNIPEVPTQIPEFTNSLAVSTGFNFVCSLSTAGTAKCFGENIFGGLGNNLTDRSDKPVAVIGLNDGVDLVSNKYASCALTTSGSVKCWGLGFSGSAEEIPKLAGIKFKSIAASVGGKSFSGSGGGGSWFCGITTNENEVKCWNGKNETRDLASDYMITRLTLGGSMSDFFSWTINKSETGIVRNLSLGENNFGQTAQSNTFPQTSTTAVAITLPKTVVDIHAGSSATYFIYSDNTVGMVGKKYETLRGPSPVLRDLTAN